jgi:hypothetical protein
MHGAPHSLLGDSSSFLNLRWQLEARAQVLKHASVLAEEQLGCDIILRE